MPYTLEDYRRDIKERALKMMTPEERLRGLSAEEIEACLKKMRKAKKKRKE